MKIGSIILFLFSPLILFGQSPPELKITPGEWDFGTISHKNSITQEITIQNTTQKTLEVSIITTCDCLEVDTNIITLPARETAKIIITLNPFGESGEIEKNLFFLTNLNNERIFFFIQGKVLAEDEAINTGEIKDINIDDSFLNITLDFYYELGCKRCQYFLETEIPRLEKTLGIKILINKKDVLTAAYFAEYMNRLQVLGNKIPLFPAIILGNQVLQGEDELYKDLSPAIENYIRHMDRDNLRSAGDIQETTLLNNGLSVLPAILWGLGDGINPCAFSTIIFLISYLAFIGRSRREVLMIGLFFTLTVFIVYYLIGLGFFYALRAAQFAPIIAKIINWLLISILIVFAGLSVYDYAQIRRGKHKKIILQLPGSLKKRIHHSIKSYVKSAALVTSTIILGFLVSVFELACTGQWYFPFIAYSVQVKGEISHYLMLLIYNFFFILPLAIVFIFSYIGVSSERITKIFQKNMGRTKIFFAAFFLIIAIILIIQAF